MKLILKIVSVCILLLFVLVMILPYMLSLFSIDKKLKDYVVTRLNSNGKRLVTIDDIDLGFGFIELSDIMITSEFAAANVVIKSVKFKYNIFKILTNVTSPQNSINNIILTEPKLILKRISQDDLL